MTPSSQLRAVADNIEKFWAPLAMDVIGKDETNHRIAKEDADCLRRIATELEHGRS